MGAEIQQARGEFLGGETVVWYLYAKVKEGFLVFGSFCYWDTMVEKSVEQGRVETCHTVLEKSAQKGWFDFIVFEAADLHICVHTTCGRCYSQPACSEK